jgi:hypothetical protein
MATLKPNDETRKQGARKLKKRRRTGAETDALDDGAGETAEAVAEPSGDDRPARPRAGSPLAAALAYAARGFHVFPCHTVFAPTQDDGRRIRVCSCGNRQCSSPGKHPTTPHGWKDATGDPDQIRSLWGARPDLNVAIATEQSRLVVIDIDPARCGDETWAALGVETETAT